MGIRTMEGRVSPSSVLVRGFSAKDIAVQVGFVPAEISDEDFIRFLQGGGGSASTTTFDDAVGLGANNVQAAIEQLLTLIGVGAPTDTILLSGSGVAENQAVRTLVGTLSTNGTGSFTYSLVDNLGGKLAVDPVDSSKLYTVPGTTFDYETQFTVSPIVRAVRGDGFAFEMPVVIPILDDLTDNPPTPAWTAKFRTAAYTGGVGPTNFGVTSGDVVAGVGLPITPGDEFIGPHSKDPAGWSSFFGAGIVSSVVATRTVNGFSVVDYHMNYDRHTSTGLRAMTAGEKVTVTFKFGYVPGQPTTGGYHLYMGGIVVEDKANNSTDVLGPPNPNDGSWHAGVVYVGRTVDLTTNTQEVTFTLTAQVNGTPYFAIESYNNGPSNSYISEWGIQAVIGAVAKPWTTVVSTIVTATGTTLLTTGGVKSTLAGTSGGIVLRLKNVSSARPAKVFSRGTTGNENVLCRVTGDLTGDAAATTAALVGYGGFLGSVMFGLTWSGTQYRICLNEGKVITVTAALAAGVNALLLDGTICTVEEAYGYNSFLTAAELRLATHLGDMNGVALSGTTFNDYFPDLALEDIIRTRPSVAMSSINPGNTGNVDLYTGRGSNGRAMWMPRYATDKTNKGSNLGGGERQWYPDPSQPGLPAGYASVSPFLKAPDGAFRIRFTPYSMCPSDVQAIMPNRFSSGSFLGTDYGEKLEGISGAVTTAGLFETKFGYIEAMIKNPTHPWAWPAFWTLSGRAVDYNPSQGPAGKENDIWEKFGDARGATALAMNLHLNMYGYNQEVVGDGSNGSLFVVDPGIDYTTKYATLGCLWWPGYVQYYINGMALGSPLSTAGKNMDLTSDYLLLNMAMGANFIRGGTAINQALGQCFFDILQVRVLSVA